MKYPVVNKIIKYFSLLVLATVGLYIGTYFIQAIFNLGVNFGTISLFIIFMKQSVKLYNPPLNANVHFKNCN